MSWVYKCHTIELIPQDMKLVQILLFSFIQSYIIMSSATTATAANTADAATTTVTNVFAIGRYKTVLQKVETRSCTTKSTLAVPPPKPLLIARPSEAGEYPILVLLHGYLLYNSFYSQLIQHIASHGFIVIAPQLYILAGPDTTDEIKSTAAITNWLSEGLHYLLPPHVQPNINKLGLAGHSRGGKVAFALALDKEATSLKFSALIGIDPVDGMDKGKQTPPPVLTYVPHSFDLDMAVMVIGTGLGEVKKNPLFPPCAPKGVNHEDFFNECQEPACHFVAKDYGHLDLLDDDTEGLRGKTTYCLCKNGKSREPMRRFVGGIVVAFMNAYLLGDDKDLLAIKDGQKTVPVELKPIVCIG
nr:chlorophyllase-2, chloroplastic [Quercus suber]